MNLDRIKKIYTNGSSITWGWLLDHREVMERYSRIGLHYEEKESVIWPNLIARELNLELFNDSRWGGSIDRLVRTTYEYCFNNIDSINQTLFILEIPIGFRTEIFSNSLGRIVNITHGNISSCLDLTEDNDYEKIYPDIKKWFSDFVNLQFKYEEQSLKFTGLISFLEINKIDYFIIGGIDYIDNDLISYNIKNINKKIKSYERFIPFDGEDPFCIFKWYSKHLKKTLKDEIGFQNNHPGILAHSAIAKYILSYIQHWPENSSPLDSKKLFNGENKKLI